MLDPQTIATLARRLYEARRSRTPLRQFSREHPGMSVADGYAIQREWVRLELADGRTIRGRKIGLTSRAMQQSSQIDEPDYAPLMDDMFFEQGTDLPFDRFIAPRVEVELAFVLGRPLRGPGVTLFDVLSATEYVTPAVEIIDARIEQFDREDADDAQGLRHDLGFRRQRRHRHRRAPRQANRGRLALGRRDALSQRRDRGDRARRRRPQSPRHRSRLARQQARTP